ncbi:MAG: type II toxin-antitoxin system RelE/ParE family toxin [Bacteroidetes bacterium]|nr:type II toxin-antitoxin system RelE/ParE family toxin [Bacteroidota bacterium]
MGLEVRWTEKAEFTFDHIVSFIENNWGKNSSEKFINKTAKLLLSISVHPFLFPESGIDNVRKAVITRQTSLFYEVHADRIMLVFFGDNRQDPLFS